MVDLSLTLSVCLSQGGVCEPSQPPSCGITTRVSGYGYAGIYHYLISEIPGPLNVLTQTHPVPQCLQNGKASPLPPKSTPPFVSTQLFS